MWEVGEGTVEVPMKLGKVWDASAERWRVDQYRRDVASGSELHTRGWWRKVGAG